MDPLDQEFGAMALEMIGEAGTAITITVPGTGYDPKTRTTSGTARTISATGSVQASRARFLEGDGEVQATKQVLVAAQALPTDYVPKQGHKVTIGATTYTVAGVDATQPKDVVVMYALHLRN